MVPLENLCLSCEALIYRQQILYYSTFSYVLTAPLALVWHTISHVEFAKL